MRAFQHSKPKRFTKCKKKCANTRITQYRRRRRFNKYHNIKDAVKLNRRIDIDSWVLMPKDSCEVYKARRKRQLENQPVEERNGNDSERDDMKSRSKEKVCRQCRHSNKKKTSNRRRRQHKRSSPETSASTITLTSVSTDSIASSRSYNSCSCKYNTEASDSEMDN